RSAPCKSRKSLAACVSITAVTTSANPLLPASEMLSILLKGQALSSASAVDGAICQRHTRCRNVVPFVTHATPDETTMTYEKHLNKMSHYFNAGTPHDHLADNVPAQDDSSEAPLGNFFGDDFLMLLYHSTDACRPMLTSVKTNLQTVGDRVEPRHQRAQAAVMLGRFVREHYGSAYNGPGKSTPNQWFDLARQLNSVVGAYELANTLLTEREWEVEFDLDRDPLPRLMRVSDDPTRPAPTATHEL